MQRSRGLLALTRFSDMKGVGIGVYRGRWQKKTLGCTGLDLISDKFGRIYKTNDLVNQELS